MRYYVRGFIKLFMKGTFEFFTTMKNDSFKCFPIIRIVEFLPRDRAQVLSRLMFVASKILMVSTTVFRVMVEYVLSYCSDAFGIYEWTFGTERSDAHTL